jgi:DNA-binding MarR family transcriptional regulator
MEPTRASLQAKTDFGLTLSLVLRNYLAAADAALDGLPGGPRGYFVLTSAAYEQPPTQLKLAQQLGIDRSVLTYLLDDLERAGLIERKPDPADRRARRIVVTPGGVKRLKKLQTELEGAEAHALRGLTTKEQETFRGLLGRACSGEPEQTQHGACTIVESVAEKI